MRPPPWWEKIHLEEEVLLRLIHYSPIFDQILLMYLSLDLFLPFLSNLRLGFEKNLRKNLRKLSLKTHEIKKKDKKK